MLSIRLIIPRQLSIQYFCLMIANAWSFPTCKLSSCTFLAVNWVKGWSIGMFTGLIPPPTLTRPLSKTGFRWISFEFDGIDFEDDIKLHSFGNDSNWACRKRIILLWLISAVANLKFSFLYTSFHFIQFSFSLSIHERWRIS